MPTIVKVRKWGNSLGLLLPKSFATQHAIEDGSSIEIDQIKIVEARPRRRSRHRLKDLLKNHQRPPKSIDFAPVGKEVV